MAPIMEEAPFTTITNPELLAVVDRVFGLTPPNSPVPFEHTEHVGVGAETEPEPEPTAKVPALTNAPDMPALPTYTPVHTAEAAAAAAAAAAPPLYTSFTCPLTSSAFAVFAPRVAPKCTNGHGMAVSTHQAGDYTVGWECDACQSQHTAGSARWFCTKCLADICFGCHADLRTAAATITARTDISTVDSDASAANSNHHKRRRLDLPDDPADHLAKKFAGGKQAISEVVTIG